MKERQILFSAPMVRAKLDGRKTQTRRICNPQPVSVGSLGKRRVYRDEEFKRAWETIKGTGECDQDRDCPYGQPGDRLWVKETFYAYGRWETRFDAAKGRDAWHFVDMTIESGKQYRYAADMGDNGTPERGKGGVVRWWKRPAIFMPRVASRLTDEITAVRVERLWNISDADAIAEGIARYENHTFGLDDPAACMGPSATVAYMRLWEHINGPGSWDANPWVWVVEFRRVPT